ncbi:hypothetical protein BGX38DRAFT_1224062 [Terfezia claveryi]|nr:hypothetical protein BGX38DRAFT_1224062 [Terfezia claveryi]
MMVSVPSSGDIDAASLAAPLFPPFPPFGEASSVVALLVAWTTGTPGWGGVGSFAVCSRICFLELSLSFSPFCGFGRILGVVVAFVNGIELTVGRALAPPHSRGAPL